MIYDLRESATNGMSADGPVMLNTDVKQRVRPSAEAADNIALLRATGTPGAQCSARKSPKESIPNTLIGCYVPSISD